MFNTIVFARDARAKLIQGMACKSKVVRISKTIRPFPSLYELARLLNCFAPELVLLELDPFDDALKLASQIRAMCPAARIIGIGETYDGEKAWEARVAGIADVLSEPLSALVLETTAAQVLHGSGDHGRARLFSFLPVKAGCGATTVAVNVAGCLANDLGQRVAAIDADLRSGLLSVLLKATAEYSVIHALVNADVLDELAWGQTAVEAQGIDLLASPRSGKTPMLLWTHYYKLLRFARSCYDAVVVDLPEVVNDATQEVVQSATNVFIVTTAELPALTLARQRLQDLEDRGVHPGRVSFILNRLTKSDMSVKEVEECLEAPVLAALPNDYRCVRRAIEAGQLVGRKSELGVCFSQLARLVAGFAPESSAAPAWLPGWVRHHRACASPAGIG
jgi:pilus assembly protein CpaE